VVHPDADCRILWASPLPPTHSGVADYATELLPALADRAKVRVVRPPSWKAPADWPAELEMVPTDETALQDERTLLHLGNNPHHLWLLPRLHADRCVVVLHDAVLHHLLVESTKNPDGDVSALAAELEKAHGAAGAALARARRAGHHGRLDPFLFSARRSFVSRARAVIVHSDWAATALAREFPGLAIARVALAAADPQPVDRAASCAELGVDPEQTILMHLGFLSEEKGLEEILTGVAAAVRMGTDLRFVLVGEGREQTALRRVTEDLGLGDRVTVTGWIPAEFIAKIPAAADLGVVLRTPSAGETSAAALRFLACGVPVAMGGGRQFLEWPESAAPRLTPGPSAAAELARLIGEIGGAAYPARRLSSRRVYEASHRPETVAAQLIDFLCQLDDD